MSTELLRYLDEVIIPGRVFNESEEARDLLPHIATNVGGVEVDMVLASASMLLGVQSQTMCIYELLEPSHDGEILSVLGKRAQFEEVSRCLVVLSVLVDRQSFGGIGDLANGGEWNVLYARSEHAEHLGTLGVHTAWIPSSRGSLDEYGDQKPRVDWLTIVSDLYSTQWPRGTRVIVPKETH